MPDQQKWEFTYHCLCGAHATAESTVSHEDAVDKAKAATQHKGGCKGRVNQMGGAGRRAS